MKKILGLDIGITAIGWSFILEANNENEVSSIINAGVRVVPLTVEEENDFKKGKTISINADRTLKRIARRGIQRFKQRREALLESFRKINFINTTFIYAETAKETTFSSYKLRAQSATEAVSKEEFVQVLLMLNKKRGYKSSRKAKTVEEGDAIDEIKISKEIFEKNITPGQWVFNSLSNGDKYIPSFYPSDLQKELEKIIIFQQQFYPNIINEKLIGDIHGKSRIQTSQYFLGTIKTELAENKGTREETKLQQYKWRNDALSNKLDLKSIAFSLVQINHQINESSSYLGAISDRSKDLYLNQETVGQFQYKQLQNNAHSKLKNQVFYRQDYIEEFDRIWETQAKYHPELNEKLKSEVRNFTIFYQRKLKSQKHLISQCEFEKGHKAIPKSSPLFQEFRIWQNLNNTVLKNQKTKKSYLLSEELKQQIAEELKFKDGLTDIQLMTFCKLEKESHSVNIKKIEGNKTNIALYKAFEKILEMENFEVDFSKMTSLEIKQAISKTFNTLNINTEILDFDPTLQGNDFDKQAYYQLWHLLYSSEKDEHLKKTLMTKFNFKENHIPLLLNINLQANYGNLSAKAIKKVLPHLKDGHVYDNACYLSGYNHSASLTTDQNKERVLKDTLDLIKKNSLRSPVVEKIMNQMINVINTIIADPTMGKPDEIRVELANELKYSNEQRSQMAKNINKNTAEHEQIKKLLHSEFGIQRITRNDIIRYKLWKETDGISLYTGKPIEPSKLFSKEYDIDHIIPKSRLFDDSFSNKIICERQLNIDKRNQTAYSFFQEKLSPEEFEQFERRIQSLFGKITRTKKNKLLMTENKIPKGFIDKQLREKHYITKKTKEILLEVSRNVTVTIGSLTEKLREDWKLVDLIKELNWEKYHKLGLTSEEEGKNGEHLNKIQDWSRRNDHRHQALDAIIVAFTKPNYIQYLNNLNTKDLNTKTINSLLEIEAKYLKKDKNNKWRFSTPMPNFRVDAKKQLENILISYKVKNKVVTNNKNTTKIKGGAYQKVQLTPRGQLHKETVYGKIQQFTIIEKKLGTNFTIETIGKVAKKQDREALLIRLAENNNDPKKAFSSKNILSKNSIEPDVNKIEKVKMVCLNNIYTIRKKITPDLKIDKVIDIGLKTILQDRLKEFNGDTNKAFINLEENPIWQNQEKGITIKRVAVSGVSNAQALHTKKDHLGNEILDTEGNTIGVDFVSTRNNHHVAIYKDEKGNLREEVVSFYDAVIRKNLGLSIINKNHEKAWEFLFSIKQNEFFIFPSENFNPKKIDLLNYHNYHLISPNIFRVQKFGSLQSGFWFRHHLETQIEIPKKLKDITYKVIQSPNNLKDVIKVRINHIGKIVQLGEY